MIFNNYPKNKKIENISRINIYDYCDENFEEVVREILEKLKILKNIQLTYNEEIQKNLQEMKDIKSNLLNKKIRLIK